MFIISCAPHKKDLYITSHHNINNTSHLIQSRITSTNIKNNWKRYCFIWCWYTSLYTHHIPINHAMVVSKNQTCEFIIDVLSKS